MKHIVITRMNFEDDELFDHYFQIMKKTFAPSINSQKNKNFELVLNINPKHIELVKPYFQQTTNFFHSIEEIKKYCSDQNFEIQTRHDCDDWMSDDYIDKIQELYNSKISTHDKFIIHSKVEKLNFYTGEIHKHGTSYENNNFISMFLSLCQQNVEHFVYDKNHRFMNEITPNVYLLDGGYTRLVIHEKNKFSKINPNDKFIKNDDSYHLSVIVPTFDNVEYLEEFFDSVLKSVGNYKIEFLIGIDNCEKTKDYILQKLDSLKNNFRFFFFDKSVGPYIIRNSLLKISNAKKLLFIDSDDLVNPKIISEVIENLNSHDIVRFKFYNFYKPSDLIEFKEENINPFLSIGQLGVNKNIIMDLNGFEPWECSADSEFKMREEGNKLKVKNIHDILYYRRRHDKNLTKKIDHGSKIRQNYLNLISQRKRKQIIGKLSRLHTTNFFEITQTKNLKPIILDPNFETQKQIIEDSVLEVEKTIEVKIERTIELKKKELNYEKINVIFNSNNIPTQNSVKKQQPPQPKLNSNSATITKMFGKNIRKRR